MRSMGTGLACTAGAVAGAYAGYVGAVWLRYGRVGRAPFAALLDAFMPDYDVVERHSVRVGAPADVTLTAACELDLERSAVIHAIFRGREVILGSDPDAAAHPRGLVAFTKSIGWGVLADVHGHEIVMGAVTQPWKADVVFRALPPDEFAAFHEPDFVKIVWTLRADALSADACVVSTETRVMTTDPAARRKFRRYWAVFSPGIILIRREGLTRVKADAEGRARARRPASSDRFDLVSSGNLDPQCRQKESHHGCEDVVRVVQG
jgi:hypothetical protein